MIIQGQFKDIKNEHTYRVVISPSYIGQNITIGTDNSSHVWFDADPCVIKTNCEDNFTHIIKTQATVNLVTDIWLGDYLFAENITSIPIQIYEDNLCIFDGYVEHNTYSQPYENNWNAISLNCVDHLELLELQRMTDLSDYDTLKQNSNIRTLSSLFTTILGGTANIYYDGSKRGYTSSNSLSDYVLDCYKILDTAWLGDNEDDLWSNETIVNEILKYLNLHIIQMYDYANTNNNYAYYLFDWDYTQKYSTEDITYNRFTINLKTNSQVGNSIPISLQTLNPENYAASDTNFTIDDVYNKISIKEDPKTEDTFVANPLDTNELDSWYGQHNRHMTEFVSIGEGEHSKNTLVNMVKGTSDYTWSENRGWYRHWYMRPLYNPDWEMWSYQIRTNEGTPTGADTWFKNEEANYIFKDTLTTPYNTANAISNQVDMWSLAKAAHYRGYNTITDTCTSTTPRQVAITGDAIMPTAAASIIGKYKNLDPVRRPNVIGASMMSFFSTGKITTDDSSTVKKKENEGKWLCISVGNNLDYDTEQLLATSDGVCRYKTNNAASLVPPNDDITYHLVFSGSIMLMPFINRVIDYDRIRNNQTEAMNSNITDLTSNFFYGNDDGCGYVRVFYNNTPTLMDLGQEYNQLRYKEYPSVNHFGYNVMPPIEDDGLTQWPYRDNGNGDTIEKVGVLLCRLKIGDKYLQEGFNTKTIDGETYYYPNNTYTWVDSADISDLSQAVFTIGFDPKLDDWVVGQKYDIGTDISFLENIDTKYGMDIEITRADHISGKMEFTILGPCRLFWDNNRRRHATLFRHSRRYTNTVNIFNIQDGDTCPEGGGTLSFNSMNIRHWKKCTDNIFIKELTCKLYTNNAGNNYLQDHDIIYMSDETNRYVDEKDEIDFKLMSGFTTQESQQFGANMEPTINNVYNANDEPNILLNTRIQYSDDNGLITKPEKLYVKQYWDEYNKVKMKLDTTLKYTGQDMYFKRYKTNYFNKTFYMLENEVDLKYKTIKTTMKEI